MIKRLFDVHIVYMCLPHHVWELDYGRAHSSKSSHGKTICHHKQGLITLFITFVFIFNFDVYKGIDTNLFPSGQFCTALHCIALHFITLHWIGLDWTALHCKTLHCTAFTLHCTAFVLHCTALHCTALHCTALHCTALHSTAQHCTALHCTALHCTALHCTALHCIALHCIAFALQGCTTLHRIALQLRPTIATTAALAQLLRPTTHSLTHVHTYCSGLVGLPNRQLLPKHHSLLFRGSVRQFLFCLLNHSSPGSPSASPQIPVKH